MCVFILAAKQRYTKRNNPIVRFVHSAQCPFALFLLLHFSDDNNNSNNRFVHDLEIRWCRFGRAGWVRPKTYRSNSNNSNHSVEASARDATKMQQRCKNAIGQNGNWAAEKVSRTHTRATGWLNTVSGHTYIHTL